MISIKNSFLRKGVSLFKNLQDSDLVYAFQNYFGVQRVDSSVKNGSPSSALKHVKSENETAEVSARKTLPVMGSKLQKYVIRSKFWYYVFSFGTSLGYELFYATFFPFWVWNLNAAICRRVVNLWVFVMYVGQALKDIICWPRPSSPPVVHMEPKYVQEFGMPSTHAMVSVALPFAFLYFTSQRYEFPLSVGLFIALAWCILVCCSRLYMGMHTVLDIIGGLLLSPVLMIMFLPISDAVDQFQMKNSFSPLITLVTMIILQIIYPKNRSYTPARGDTSVIMGTGTGFAIGTWLNFRQDMIYGGPPPSSLIKLVWPSNWFIVLALLRTMIGLLCIVIARAILKNFLYKIVCYVLRLDPEDPSCRQKTEVEMPYKYLTYIVIGYIITGFAPLVFQILDIERSTVYTES